MVFVTEGGGQVGRGFDFNGDVGCSSYVKTKAVLSKSEAGVMRVDS